MPIVDGRFLHLLALYILQRCCEIADTRSTMSVPMKSWSYDLANSIDGEPRFGSSKCNTYTNHMEHDIRLCERVKAERGVAAQLGYRKFVW